MRLCWVVGASGRNIAYHAIQRLAAGAMGQDYAVFGRVVPEHADAAHLPALVREQVWVQYRSVDGFMSVMQTEDRHSVSVVQGVPTAPVPVFIPPSITGAGAPLGYSAQTP